eukprot:5277072-Prymnesium_polylepis.1
MLERSMNAFRLASTWPKRSRPGGCGIRCGPGLRTNARQHTSTALGSRMMHVSPANPVPSCAASRD